MTKEDYLNLPKERLAELLAERDLMDLQKGLTTPSQPIQHYPLCPFGGYCTNQFKDCVGCPGPIYDGSLSTTKMTINTLK